MQLYMALGLASIFAIGLALQASAAWIKAFEIAEFLDDVEENFSQCGGFGSAKWAWVIIAQRSGPGRAIAGNKGNVIPPLVYMRPSGGDHRTCGDLPRSRRAAGAWFHAPDPVCDSAIDDRPRRRPIELVVDSTAPASIDAFDDGSQPASAILVGVDG
jgi:hypothetical protein